MSQTQFPSNGASHCWVTGPSTSWLRSIVLQHSSRNKWRGAVGLSPPSGSSVDVIKSRRSSWQSSFLSRSCFSRNSSCSSVLRPVRDPSTALNRSSTAAFTEFRSPSMADTCSMISTYLRASLSTCSVCHLTKSSSCSLCLSIFSSKLSCHLLLQSTCSSGSHCVIPLLTPICTVLGSDRDPILWLWLTKCSKMCPEIYSGLENVLEF